MFTTHEAYIRRDRGIALSEEKANRNSPGWSDRARACVIMFCTQSKGKRFLLEDVRGWAESIGLIEPPENEKSWGGVVRRCAKEGIIKQDGYLPAKSSNMSPKTAWRSA